MRYNLLIGISYFFFNVSMLKAQLKFFEGYIVLNTGDTVVGEIKANPQKELMLFSKVMFKDAQGITKTYKADKIKAFVYFLADKKDEHRFVAIQEDEPKFYKLVIQYPFMIYEYQYEDMKLGGKFYAVKEYYIQENKKFVRLNSRKLKKQLAEYINNEEILSEVEKMKELDINKVSSLLEKYYSKSPS